MNIADFSAMERTAIWIDELIQVCRKGGLIYSKNPKLTSDVTRKAKALRTSLDTLRNSLIPKEKCREPFDR